MEMLGPKKKVTLPVEPKPVQEPYDRLVRELQFATKFDGEKAHVNAEVIDSQDADLLQVTDDYKTFEESVLQSSLIQYAEATDEFGTTREFPELNVQELNNILFRVIKYYKATEKSKLNILCKHLLEFVTEWADYPQGMNFVFDETEDPMLSHFHTMVLSDPKACAEIFLSRIGTIKSRFEGAEDRSSDREGMLCESMVRGTRYHI
jgi:hypothetical protein